MLENIKISENFDSNFNENYWLILENFYRTWMKFKIIVEKKLENLDHFTKNMG